MYDVSVWHLKSHFMSHNFTANRIKGSINNVPHALTSYLMRITLQSMMQAMSVAEIWNIAYLTWPILSTALQLLILWVMWGMVLNIWWWLSDVILQISAKKSFSIVAQDVSPQELNFSYSQWNLSQKHLCCKKRWGQESASYWTT